MQKKLIIAGILILVVLGGYFLLRLDNNTPRERISENIVAQKGLSILEASAAYSEFVKKGGSLKCITKSSENGGEANAIVYISNRMAREEVTIHIYQNFSMDATVIVRDGYMYSWDPSTKNGGRTKMPESSEIYPFSQINSTGSYDCEPWEADASMFDLPKDVIFKQD